MWGRRGWASILFFGSLKGAFVHIPMKFVHNLSKFVHNILKLFISLDYLFILSKNLFINFDSKMKRIKILVFSAGLGKNYVETYYKLEKEGIFCLI